MSFIKNVLLDSIIASSTVMAWFNLTLINVYLAVSAREAGRADATVIILHVLKRKEVATVNHFSGPTRKEVASVIILQVLNRKEVETVIIL